MSMLSFFAGAAEQQSSGAQRHAVKPASLKKLKSTASEDVEATPRRPHSFLSARQHPMKLVGAESAQNRLLESDLAPKRDPMVAHNRY